MPSHLEEQALDSSFVTWCTKCLVDHGINITTADANAHTAASNAADYLASHSDTTWIVIAACTIVIGLIFLFAGYETFYFTLSMVAFLCFGLSSFGLLCGAANSLAAAIAVGAVVALIAAFVVVKCEKLGAALCGAAGGAITYLYLNGFLLNHLYDAIPEAHQTWTPIVILCVLLLVGMLLAMCMERPAIILTTALGGAYGVGWACDRLIFKSAHHNLNPIVLVSGGGCHAWQCYVILAAIVVLACIGAFVQFRRTYEEAHLEGEPGRLRVLAKPRRVSGYEGYEYSQDLEAPDVQFIQGAGRRASREKFVHV